MARRWKGCVQRYIVRAALCFRPAKSYSHCPGIPAEITSSRSLVDKTRLQRRASKEPISSNISTMSGEALRMDKTLMRHVPVHSTPRTSFMTSLTVMDSRRKRSTSSPITSEKAERVVIRSWYQCTMIQTWTMRDLLPHPSALNSSWLS